MSSPKLIKFYKGIILPKIHDHVSISTEMSIDDLDLFLKDYADLEGSTTKMSLEDLKSLVEWALYFANTIECKVDYPQDDLDKQINFNEKLWSDK